MPTPRRPAASRSCRSCRRRRDTATPRHRRGRSRWYPMAAHATPPSLLQVVDSPLSHRSPLRVPLRTLEESIDPSGLLVLLVLANSTCHCTTQQRSPRPAPPRAWLRGSLTQKRAAAVCLSRVHGKVGLVLLPARWSPIPEFNTHTGKQKANFKMWPVDNHYTAPRDGQAQPRRRAQGQCEWVEGKAVPEPSWPRPPPPLALAWAMCVLRAGLAAWRRKRPKMAACRLRQ